MSEPRRARLILHIGLEKTGTTALQRFFAGNRRALGLAGLHYPAVPGEARAAKHTDLAAALVSAHAAGGTPSDYTEAAEVLARYLGPAETRRATLLSAEELSGPDAAIAAMFAPYADKFDIRVIAYLRRQDEWALSAWRERVVNPDHAEARGLADWLSDPATDGLLDYNAMLEGWRKSVGKEAIRVLRYPYELPLLRHFLQAAGLPAALSLLPHSNKRVRESVGEEVLLKRLAENGGLAEPPRFDQAARDALLDRYAAGNERVCQLFRPELGELFGRS